MDFHPDDAVLEFLDDELLAARTTFPQVSAMVIFEMTSGARRQLSSLDAGTPWSPMTLAETTFESDMLAVVFAYDAHDAAHLLYDGLYRVARRVNVIVEPHLRRHLAQQDERVRRNRTRHTERSARHAHPI